MGVEALDRGRDRGIALGERQERLTAQPAQDVGLGEADPRLALWTNESPGRFLTWFDDQRLHFRHVAPDQDPL